MARKTRHQFTEEQKRKAVADYVSGEKRAEDIARELGVPQGYLYKWRVQLDEHDKGARVEELEALGHSRWEARKIQSLEAEIEEYKKKLAEQVLINDLLKKLQTSKASQRESELTGLIRTSRNLDRKGGPAK
ncbi:MAG: transposase [Bdellovibrionales bacterium]|jgi:transposase-like protein|nr:transposase [Bdellovibrionales bacterium]